MFNNFSKNWKYLEDKGIITNQEFINATFTQHYRTVEEFRSPFDDKESAISKSGLILKSCETMITECPYNCLLYTSPSPRDMRRSRMPSSA